jgi:hypothetical protein
LSQQTGITEPGCDPRFASMANHSTTSSQFPANLPVFKGEHYDRWCAQMKVIFRFQDVLEIVNEGCIVNKRRRMEKVYSSFINV